MAEIFAGRDRQDSSLAGGFQMSSAVHGPINVDGLWIELAFRFIMYVFAVSPWKLFLQLKALNSAWGSHPRRVQVNIWRVRQLIHDRFMASECCLVLRPAFCAPGWAWRYAI